MKIKKAIFPVAGFGTRFLPVTKAQPKEMLPIVDKPVIQYLVEEAVKSGIEEIIIVTGRGKRSIEDHFDHSFELKYNLVEKGKDDLLKEVEAIETMAKFSYVRQPRPLGDGDAIMQAESLIGNEPFLVLFGDDIVDNEVPAAKQLIDAYHETQSPMIALTRVLEHETDQYGILDSDDLNTKLYRAKGFVEKPAAVDAPTNLGIIGKYVLTPDIFDALRRAPQGKDGELRLIDGLLMLLKERKIYGLEVEGKRYDAGSKMGFLKATIEFALKRPDLAAELKVFLKNLDLGE